MDKKQNIRPFLSYVAEDILRKHGTNLSRVAVVFPNKRASLFMNQYLAHSVSKPLWSPSYLTISDLFRKNSTLHAADPIKLICDLHKVFCRVTGINETLDHFYGWGQLLLSDFDDIDKNMADARRVFANLRDIHELDDVSYLTDEQKVLLSRFFGNFSVSQNSILKERFLKLWSNLYEIYTVYNETLTSQGLAYEGSLYRQVVTEAIEREKLGEKVLLEGQYDKYIFVGFNMVQKVEQQLFELLQKQNRALFYWDFDNYYMHSEAGHYIKQFLKYFPNEFDSADKAIYDNFCQQKDITFISATTETSQARYVSQWLREHSGHRISSGSKTAIVLCDENLLPAVVHSIPDEVEKANITTGYPLANSPFASLLNTLIEMQTDHNKIRLAKIHHRLSGHPYMQYITDEALLHKKITPASAPSLSENFILDLSAWLADILKHIGMNARQTNDDPLFQESLFRTYTIVNRLNKLVSDGDLLTDAATFRRLLTQIINTTSIPFHGEPAEGIQVMGVLETRNLDFDHVLLLSCNEGNMPKGVNDSSFIPYSIRRAYDLTTIDNKVAIYAYYFHRLLQRAQDVTIIYNNATDDGHKGEMSRFMLQLLVESPHNIQRKSLQSNLSPSVFHPTDVVKSNHIIERLHSIQKLSPTAINNYLRCQLRFFYQTIIGIKEEDTDNYGEIDSRGFGDIFHLSAQLIYQKLMQKSPVIEKNDLDYLLKHTEDIERIVDQAISDVFRKRNIKHSAAVNDMNGLQLINRRVIIDYVRQLLQIDIKNTPFRIMGLEKTISLPLTPARGIPSSILLEGQIDRIDSKDGHIRVVDYKTGSKKNDNMPSLHDIFTGEKVKDHSDYFLQSMLYSVILKEDSGLNPEQLPVSPALLYIQHSREDGYSPIIKINGAAIDDIQVYQKEFMSELEDILYDMFDANKPFSPTTDKSRCENCPYKQLCY